MIRFIKTTLSSFIIIFPKNNQYLGFDIKRLVQLTCPLAIGH